MRWTVAHEAFGAKLLKVLRLFQVFFQKERFLQLLRLRGYPEQVRVVIRSPQTSIVILLRKIVGNVDLKTLTILQKGYS